MNTSNGFASKCKYSMVHVHTHTHTHKPQSSPKPTVILSLVCTSGRFLLNAPKKMVSNYYSTFHQSMSLVEKADLVRKKIKSFTWFLSCRWPLSLWGQVFQLLGKCHYCAKVRERWLSEAFAHVPPTHQMLNDCHVPGTISKSGDAAVSEAYQTPCPYRIYLPKQTWSP